MYISYINLEIVITLGSKLETNCISKGVSDWLFDTCYDMTPESWQAFGFYITRLQGY